MRKTILNKLIYGAVLSLMTLSAGMSATASDGEVLFSENYENPVCATINSGNGVIETDDITGNKYMHVTGAWSANQFGYAIPEIAEGKIQVRFDYMKKDLTKQTYIVLANNNYYSGKEWFRLFGVSGAGQITALTNADGMGKMEADKWYTQVVTVDVDTREATAELYEQGGEIPLATLHYDYVPTNTSSYGYGGWPETSKSFVRFRHFGDNDGYLDNIEIKYIYDKPSLSPDKITIMNPEGDIQSNKQEVIASANVIRIDFKTYMDESSLTENSFYVTKKGETDKIEAAVDTERKGHKVSATLSASKKWIPGDYTIHVSADVSNIKGDTLENEYTEDFTVISGKVAKISFSDIDGNEVNLTEGEIIKPEAEKITFHLSGEVQEDYLSGISVKNSDGEVDGERAFNGTDNTYTIALDKYLKQNSTYLVSVPYEVVGNAYEGTFTTGGGIYKVLSAEFYDADGNVTDSAGNASSITVKIVNTKELNVDYRLIFTAFNEGFMKNMQYSDFGVSESDAKFEFTMPVTADASATTVKNLLWSKTEETAIGEKELADCIVTADGKVKIEKSLYSGGAEKKFKVTVFRPGMSVAELSEGRENINVTAYTDILPTDADGKCSFEFSVDDSGFYDVEIITEDGKKEEFTVFYNDRAKAELIREKLNSADSAESFYSILYGEDENFKELGFYVNLTETADEKKVSDLMYEYITDKKFEANDDIEAIKLFRKMYAIELLNEGKEISLSEYEEYLNTESEKFYTYYAKDYITDSVKKQILKELKKRDFESDEEYTEAFLELLILKTVRYADGYGNVRDILSDFENETGIDTSSLDSGNYSKVLGKAYDGYEDLEKALTAKKSNSGNKGGSGGGGGGSSSSKPAVSITVNESQVMKPEAVPVEREAFSDIGNYAWAKEAIETLYKNGAINGKAENMFFPADSITREEFISVIIRIKGTDYKTSDAEFSDVSEGTWYEKYIKAAVADGIIKGREDGSFGVGEPVSRQDMAVIICRALGFDADVTTEIPFTDDGRISGYAQNAVYTMKEKNIITGFDDGSFMPQANATRAEASVMIYRGFYN